MTAGRMAAAVCGQQARHPPHRVAPRAGAAARGEPVRRIASTEDIVRLCIPIVRDDGPDSVISSHFGSAPWFMVVDTATRTRAAFANTNMHHEHGRCSPLETLSSERLDGVVVRSIGRNALSRLRQAGLDVLRTERETVGEALAAFDAGWLRQVLATHACGGHREREEG
jgi:predicted Fe-Mo cluster-binding NifX family protein